jgi:hypothetical protein
MKPHVKDFLDTYNDKNTFEYPPLPEGDVWTQAHWILFESNAPWLEIIGIDAPYKEMLAEAQSLKDLFVYHRNQEEGHNGWAALSVHGISANKTNIPETYGLDPTQVTYQWTEIQDRCPVTVQFFKEVFPYDKYQRLRYMLLEPGGYISPHSDNTKSSLAAAVNISLSNPTNCRLTTSAGTLPFRDSGSIFLFNNHYQHAVHNDSNTDRFHMIVHGQWRSPQWQQLVVNSYKKVING